MFNFYSIISTVGGLGWLKPAPGTIGSFAATLLAWPIHVYGPRYTLLSAAIAVFVLGWWAAENYQKNTGRGDAPEIVIDEFAGQWLVLAFAPPEIVYFVAAFVLFRIFDIFKPWPVSWADRSVKRGLGVMLDDVLAGLYAIFGLWIVAWGLREIGLQ